MPDVLFLYKNVRHYLLTNAKVRKR